MSVGRRIGRCGGPGCLRCVQHVLPQHWLSRGDASRWRAAAIRPCAICCLRTVLARLPADRHDRSGAARPVRLRIVQRFLHARVASRGPPVDAGARCGRLPGRWHGQPARPHRSGHAAAGQGHALHGGGAAGRRRPRPIVTRAAVSRACTSRRTTITASTCRSQDALRGDALRARPPVQRQRRDGPHGPGPVCTQRTRRLRFRHVARPARLVLVGALFVGSIETVFAGEINPPPVARHGAARSIAVGIGREFARGEEIGRFNMGSTVDRAVRRARSRSRRASSPARPVRLGQALARFGLTRRERTPTGGPPPRSTRCDCARDCWRGFARYFAATGALEVETPALVRAAVTDVHLESLRVRTCRGTTAGLPADVARIRDEAAALRRRARHLPGRATCSAPANAAGGTTRNSRCSSGTGSASTTTR